MMMLSLTYQQDPKKINLISTKRLKLTTKRFSPGFKHIRFQKEDYLGRFTSKFPYKKNVQLTTRPVSFRVPHIKPYKKWRSMIPRSVKKMILTPGSSSKTWDNMTQNFLASQVQAGSGNIESASFLSTYKLRDARHFPPLKKTSQLNKNFRLFAACFQQFHLPYNFIRFKLTHVLMGRRVAYIQEMRNKENDLKNRLARLSWEINKIKKVLKSLPKGIKAAKDRTRCFVDIKKRKQQFLKIKFELIRFFRTLRYKGKKMDFFATQIPYFDFVSFENTSYPHRFSRFPQTHSVLFEKGFGSILRKTPENMLKLAQRRLSKLQLPSFILPHMRMHQFKNRFLRIFENRKSKGLLTTKSANVLFKNVPKDLQSKNSIFSFFRKHSTFFSGIRKRAFTNKTAFNLFNFNTRSNQVLYRFMENLKRKFGVYYYDIPFRIDNYRKAYQKVKRPSKYKQMCIARSKIRLFYGQLTVTKMGRLLRKAPPSFPHMFGLMERRLDVLLVRSNFCKNIFTAQRIVRSGQILVNNKIHSNCYYAVKCYDFVTFRSKEFEMFCKYIILTKLRLNKFKYNFVPYLVINYKLMYLYVRPIFNARKQVGFTAPMVHSYLSRY